MYLAKTPAVSVVIPCYNSGEYLGEALASVAASEGQIAYEVIIVDDGSTDPVTKEFLRQLPADKYTLIYQENKGPAGARNRGVGEAVGEYILFLDSDNKVRSDYMAKGVRVLEEEAKVGVVYGNAAFFGLTSEVQFAPFSFDIRRMLVLNYIDMCSLVRKAVWQQVGGFDENRIIIGHEDWDFWLNVGTTEWKFKHLNEVMFDYRVRENSVLKQASEENRKQKMMQYIYSKHWQLLQRCLLLGNQELDSYAFDQRHPLRSFIKYAYKNFRKKMNS